MPNDSTANSMGLIAVRPPHRNIYLCNGERRPERLVRPGQCDTPDTPSRWRWASCPRRPGSPARTERVWHRQHTAGLTRTTPLWFSGSGWRQNVASLSVTGFGLHHQPVIRGEDQVGVKVVICERMARRRIRDRPLTVAGQNVPRNSTVIPATKGVRLHDLRHTAAVLWLTNGVHFIQVANWLGHSSYVLTMSTYADYTPGAGGREPVA